MLYEKIREMNELGKLEVFNNYLLHVGKDIIYAKSKSTFENNGWYCVLDADGFEKYLVYHYDTGKKICVRFVDGKTPQIQEADPSLPWFGEMIDVFSVLSFASDSQGNVIDIVQNALDDEAIKVNHLNTEEGDAVKLVGYDSEGNLVEDTIPEGIVVDDALNTESDNAIANAPVATAIAGLQEDKANTADLENGTLVPSKALQAKSIEAVSTESGAVQDTPFIYQGTGTANGTSIADTSPVGKHLEKQGNSVVVNEYIGDSITPNTVELNGINVIFDSKSFTINAGTSGATKDSYHFKNVPIVAGHKYLMVGFFGQLYINNSWDSNLNSNDSTTWNTPFIYTATKNGVCDCQCYILANTVYTTTKFFPRVKDLTQWFGNNIPQDLLDHPENFPRYYNGSLAYNAGTLENSDGRYLTCGGRNVWDEEVEISGDHLVSKNFIPALPNTSYYFKSPNGLFVTYYDIDKNNIGTSNLFANDTITTPSNCAFMKFTLINTYGTTYNHDITISLYYTTGDSYNQYFPYEEPKVYDTGTEPLLKAGSAKDVKAPNGVITHNVGSIDLSTIDSWEWQSDNSRWATTALSSLAKFPANNSTKANAECDKYEVLGALDAIGATRGLALTASGSIIVYNNDSSNAPTGTLYYELATPTTEQGTPFAENIEINDYGTMGWDSEVPQGCKIFYPADYALFIDSLGEKFNWDVDDIVSQSELTAVNNKIGAKIPECPTDTDGTYVLKAVVSDGEVTYSWVAEGA